MRFSVIIPAHNPSLREIYLLLPSVMSPESEILLVDDGSSKWPLTQPEEASLHRSIHVVHADDNRGPGAARNIGLDHAQGDWIVFLDSDDELAPNALSKLSDFIDANPDVDAIGYGWEYAHEQGVNQRKDGHCLSLPKRELLKEYLKLRMDGSVIYTAVKRSLIEEHGLRFRDGLHEDIDFIFNVYRHAKQTAYLPEILYRKTDRAGSIVRTISQAHIDGFMAGWESIGEMAVEEYVNSGDSGILRAYEIGTVGAIATRAREVMYRAATSSLFDKMSASIPSAWKNTVSQFPNDTLYAKVARLVVNREPIDPAIFNKSWSCTDLHNSLFLAPDEIRTCCKRFFVDGEMRGDVALVKFDQANPAAILAAKQRLHLEINKGEQTPCTGCPFLEFTAWGKIEPLQVKYLSMEHHSVCNMKCTYCDEKYYGKKQAEYNVPLLLDKLSDAGALLHCESVVWGGGEPVLGKNFPAMVSHIMERTQADHRFLTNALVFSPEIANALRSGRATVTTSIDAGTQGTFSAVRGTHLELSRVLETLKQYAAINAQAVTIKYIFTDNNCAVPELPAFVNLVLEYGLENCNFQISCDFKQDEATVDQAVSAIVLHSHLSRLGKGVVFFDDLLMQRMIGENGKIAAKGFGDGIVAKAPAEVVVFGKGTMTEWMIANAEFFKHTRIIGRNKFMAGVPVVITGAQGYAANYRKALAAGVPESFIVKSVIL